MFEFSDAAFLKGPYSTKHQLIIGFAYTQTFVTPSWSSLSLSIEAYSVQENGNFSYSYPVPRHRWHKIFHYGFTMFSYCTHKIHVLALLYTTSHTELSD